MGGGDGASPPPEEAFDEAANTEGIVRGKVCLDSGLLGSLWLAHFEEDGCISIMSSP